MSDLKDRSVELIGDRKKDEHYWIKRAGARAQLYAAGYEKVRKTTTTKKNPHTG